MHLESGRLWCAVSLYRVRGAAGEVHTVAWTLFGFIRQNFLPLLQHCVYPEGQQSPSDCRQRPVVHQCQLQEVERDPWTQLCIELLAVLLTTD